MDPGTTEVVVDSFLTRLTDLFGYISDFFSYQYIRFNGLAVQDRGLFNSFLPKFITGFVLENPIIAIFVLLSFSYSIIAIIKRILPGRV